MAGGSGPVAQASRGKRRYDSSSRRRLAQQNRKAVLEAATSLFSDRGWAASVRDIAGAAGVSVETVYGHFGSKVDLLNQVVDVAVVGDDAPVALVDRSEFTRLSEGGPTERTRAAAALNGAINQRTARLLRALREGAGTEPVLAARLDTLREAQRRTVHQAMTIVAGRPVTDMEADGVWALSTQDVYELLVGTAGWSTAQYEEWMAEAITSLLHLHE